MKKNTIVNPKELTFQKRYAWTEEETKGFIDKYHRYIVDNANLMPGAKTVLNLLKEEGHELYIITARGAIEPEYIPITEKIFKENNLEIFDKCYWGTTDKAKVCTEEKIDLMIDDYIINCERVSAVGIKTIYLKDSPSMEMEETEYLKVLYNWGEVYRYIKENLM